MIVVAVLMVEALEEMLGFHIRNVDGPWFTLRMIVVVVAFGLFRFFDLVVVDF
jgi:hypothetical protein